MIENTLTYQDGSTEILYFDPIPHEYIWNDEKIVSATNITKLLTPANVIGLWSAKMCAEKFKSLIQAGQSYDEIQLIEFYNKIKKAPNDFMTSAGNVGTLIHDAIEEYIHKGTVPEMHNPQMIKSFGKFKEWFDAQDEIEIVSTEFRVLSRIHKFCGTVDALLKIKKQINISFTIGRLLQVFVILIMFKFICINSQSAKCMVMKLNRELL
jgi:hypothetical protein